MALYSKAINLTITKEHSQKVPGTISSLIAAKTIFNTLNYKICVFPLLLLRLKILNKLRGERMSRRLFHNLVYQQNKAYRCLKYYLLHQKLIKKYKKNKTI